MRRSRSRRLTPTHVFVVAYDIQDDGVRTRLHERLKDFGTPVQYSVFECLLAPREFRRMKAAVSKIVASRNDRVKYYRLCLECRTKIETLWPQSGGEVPERAALVV